MCITLVIIQFHSKMHGPYSINAACIWLGVLDVESEMW
jgi:hypothetical protein